MRAPTARSARCARWSTTRSTARRAARLGGDARAEAPSGSSRSPRSPRWRSARRGSCAGATSEGFVTAPAARVDLVRSISATGAVNPVVTVQVGTYVSGPIQEITCDFNTKVVAGSAARGSTRAPTRSRSTRRAPTSPAAQAQLAKDRANLAYAKRCTRATWGWSRAARSPSARLDNSLSNYEQARAQVAPRRGRRSPSARPRSTPPGEPRLHRDRVARRRDRRVAQRGRGPDGGGELPDADAVPDRAAT